MRSRFTIAAVLALVSLFGYFFGTKKEFNEVTGETQRVGMTREQEVAMGLQAAPEMAAQFGGLLPDENAQALIDRVGNSIVTANELQNRPYPFEFHLLADPQTVNAFALPGGQIFITAALASRLETEGQLAGVLGHEVGHVVGRHSAEQAAKQGLIAGLGQAAGAAVYDPYNPGGAQMAQMAAQLAVMKHGRSDELESDALGVRFMVQAGYDPNSMKRVMEILRDASGKSSQPEFASTHPDPGNRITLIDETIRQQFPNGLPAGLRQ